MCGWGFVAQAIAVCKCPHRCFTRAAILCADDSCWSAAVSEVSRVVLASQFSELHSWAPAVSSTQCLIDDFIRVSAGFQAVWDGWGWAPPGQVGWHMLSGHAQHDTTHMDVVGCLGVCVSVHCSLPFHMWLRLALCRVQIFGKAVLLSALEPQPVLPDPLHSSLCCAPPESGHKVSKLKSRPLQHKTTRQPYQRILKSS